MRRKGNKLGKKKISEEKNQRKEKKTSEENKNRNRKNQENLRGIEGPQEDQGKTKKVYLKKGTENGTLNREPDEVKVSRPDLKTGVSEGIPPLV